MPSPGYRWKDGHPQRRAAWAEHLAKVGPTICPECHRPVYADDASNWDGRRWHLGHGVALVHGGTGADSQPWHATCNLRDAAAITNGQKVDRITRHDW